MRWASTVIMSSAAGGATDALNANIDIRPKPISSSPTLWLFALSIRFSMEGTYDFQPHFSPLGLATALFSTSKLAETPGITLEDSPLRRQRALKLSVTI